MSEEGNRRLATVFMVIAALLLIGGALGILALPAAIVSIWPWLVTAGAAVSAMTLVLYFSPWWQGGIAINAGLIVALMVFKWPTNEALGI